MADKVPSVTLNNGLKMPIFGLGTWKSKPGEVEKAVMDAIDAGYRSIDGAHVYENEKEVGAGIKAKIDDGTVKREDLFITSKLWNSSHSRALVVPALKKTLSDLGLDYIDLYLVHWPTGYKEVGELFPKDSDGNVLDSDVDYVDTWLGMEDCVKAGLAKSIGVSNFNKAQTERVLAAASIPPVVNQVECHPYLTQDKLAEYSKSKNILIMAYSPLGSPDRPFATDDQPVLMEDPKLKAIAAKYNKSPAQLLIKYQIQRGHICIPKSVTKSRIIANIEIFDFEVSEEDMKQLNNIGRVERYCLLEWSKSNPNYPFNEEF